MNWNQPLPPESADLYRVGSRSLWVRRTGTEVLVSAAGGDDPQGMDFGQVPLEDAPGEIQRFVANAASIHLTPRCADLPVVVRPMLPLAVLPGAEAQIYVTTPVWLCLTVDGAANPFYETPSHRPASTWFGATPQAGELAYASRSRARSRLDLVEFRPGRAVTRIALANVQAEVWNVQRIKVPAPHLALFLGSQGLWTPSIYVRNSSEGETDMLLDQTPPKEAGPVKRVAGPRQHGTPRLSLRALSGLTGWMG